MWYHTSTRRIIPALCLGLLFVAGCSKDPVSPEGPEASPVYQDSKPKKKDVQLLSKHYIVIYSGDGLPSDLANQTKRAKGKVTAEFKGAGLATATSDDPDFAAQAAKMPGVQAVVNDFVFYSDEVQPARPFVKPASHAGSGVRGNNPFLPLQWGLTAIQAPAAWNTGARGEGVIVADLDTGYDLTHPDLQDNIIGSTSFVTLPGESYDAQHRTYGTSHGTHTAGTIAAADNNEGVIGVAPKAKLLLVKVMSDAGEGQLSWLINGIIYAADHNADVINMSLTALLPRNGKFRDENGKTINNSKATKDLLSALNKATSYARKRGATIIASAGNDGIDTSQDHNWVRMPADASGVIAISATGPMGWGKAPETCNLDRFASYSNYGTPTVAFAAPGGDSRYPDFYEITTLFGYYQPTYAMDMVLSTDHHGGYSWLAGTSMAAPHASGVAALIIGKNGGQMDPARVEAILRASADDLGKPGRDPYYGFGRVNALRAVTQKK
ncbi:Serine protease, subtilisin family [Hymenobacter arizonensis]|uniref:Serine protease, subtilisin family n=1 Tax=Hymenobacter arizonensis TaxID=1227077 RepID=A0A1I6AYN1_HYMAR|nr:Serine protease, subtilisin family [Hymenobacter arizonensis]